MAALLATLLLLATRAVRVLRPLHTPQAMDGFRATPHHALRVCLPCPLHTPQAMEIYRAMPDQKLVPDSYTYVAMLSLMAKGGCELAELEAMLRDIRQHHLQV